MRLGGRLSAAIEILGDIATRHRPVSEALKVWGSTRRFAGSGDRAAIGNIVYDALRKKASNAFLMDDDSPSALAHAVLFRQWGVTPEQLEKACEGDKFAPALLDSERIQAFMNRDLADAPANIRADIPLWTQPAHERAFGDDWEAEAVAQSERPPLDLRVNALKTSRDKVVAALSRGKAQPSPLSPYGLRIEAGEGASRLPNVIAEPAFAKGWFEVQDEGSQLVADLVRAMPGEQVLDYCAGAGGKTLAISAAMGNKGQVHAFDTDRRRLSPMVERMRRAGTRNIQLHEDIATLNQLEGRFDRVLVDAPCTGSGTWRRRPDAKWRLDEGNLAKRIAEQDDAVQSGARFVRPGGILLYATCSILPDENDDRIVAFLEKNPHFEVVDMADAWQETVTPGAPEPLTTASGGIMITPHRTATDGFFIATLRRGNG